MEAETGIWRKIRASPDKFLKAENYLDKPFKGILKAIYPSEISTGTHVVKLDYEDGSSLSLFGLDNPRDDGSYSMGLGAYVESCEKLGVSVLMAGDETGIQGIKHDPELVGATQYIKGYKQSKIGSDQQTQSSCWWGILEKYEIPKPIAQSPKAAPKSRQPAQVPAIPSLDAATQTPGFDAIGTLKDFLLEFLVTVDSTGNDISDPKTEAAIMQATKKLPQHAELNKVRKAVLGDRTFVNFVNGKYELVV